MSALPKNLLYQNRVDAMGARPYTSHIQPQGSQTYGQNDVMVFNIPCNRNTVLSGADTVLTFQMNATNGATAQPYVRLAKAGASSFIQRIRLFHGSTLLEDLDNYGNLMSVLCSKQRSSDNITFKGSICEGFSQDTSVPIQAAGAAPGTAPVYSINAIRGQRVFNPTYAATTLAAGATLASANTPPGALFTYCIPLLSILGSLGSEKYVPLMELTSSPLRLEIQLVNSAQIPFVSTTAMSSFTLTNVEIVGSFIELSDQAMSVIQQSRGGAPLTMAINRYSNVVYNANLLNATTNVSIPIPFHYSSIQALLVTIRRYSAGAITFDAFGSNHFNINEYWWAFGSETVPSKHPNTHQLMWTYFASALGSPYSLDFSPAISLHSYDTLDVPAASTEAASNADGALSSIAGAFSIGQELTSFPSANQDQMFSGRNTSTEDIYLNMIFGANTTTPAVRFDGYALHHAVLICENGSASIRF